LQAKKVVKINTYSLNGLLAITIFYVFLSAGEIVSVNLFQASGNEVFFIFKTYVLFCIVFGQTSAC
jgi:hypothetical protein